MSMPDPQPNDAFEWTQEPWGRALRCTRLPVPHLFTTRDLRLRQDEDEWRDAARSLGVASERVLLAKQVHGTVVAVASRGDSAAWQRPEADAIITDDPDVAIGVLVADCAPILLWDPVRKAAAAVHAGWRGAAAAIAISAVNALKTTFGSRPADLVAAIGPCLGGCCGEVGPEVFAAFESAFPQFAPQWFSPGSGDRSFLDLERANRDQLALTGIDPVRISSSGLCTKTHAHRLHSHRAAGAGAGRMLAAVRVEGHIIIRDDFDAPLDDFDEYMT